MSDAAMTKPRDASVSAASAEMLRKALAGEILRPEFNDNPTSDARTVLPGQPVTYHQPTVANGLAAIKLDESWYSIMGGPIPAQPDPSKIVGVTRVGPPDSPEEYPPIPPAGFYWARLSCESDRWHPVEACETLGGMLIVSTSGELHPCEVTEWGPRLEPPTPVPTLPADAHAFLHYLTRAAEDLDRDIARLTKKRAAVVAELVAKLEAKR